MKKFFILFLTVFTFFSCYKEDEPEIINNKQEEVVNNDFVIHSKSCVIDSLNITDEGVYIVFSDCGKYIKNITYNINLYDEKNNLVYDYSITRYGNPDSIEYMYIPKEYLEYGNYNLNILLSEITYVYYDIYGKLEGNNIGISKRFFVNNLNPDNIQFKLLTNKFYKDNNTIILQCEDNYFELNYECKYEDFIEIYYDNLPYNNYSDGIIKFNINSNISEEKIYHNIKIKIKGSSRYLYDITVIQNEFIFDNFFNDKFTLTYGGYVMEVTSFGSFQGNVYNLNNNSQFDVNLIQCKVYIYNSLQLTVNEPITIKANDKIRLFKSQGNIDLNTVNLELIIEFNGKEYNINI